jgi:hypothetical protein
MRARGNGVAPGASGGRVRFGNLEVMDHVGIKIVMMPQARRRKDLQQEMLHRLPLVRERLQPRLIEAVAHR